MKSVIHIIFLVLIAQVMWQCSTDNSLNSTDRSELLIADNSRSGNSLTDEEGPDIGPPISTNMLFSYTAEDSSGNDLTVVDSIYWSETHQDSIGAYIVYLPNGASADIDHQAVATPENPATGGVYTYGWKETFGNTTGTNNVFDYATDSIPSSPYMLHLTVKFIPDGQSNPSEHSKFRGSIFIRYEN